MKPHVVVVGAGAIGSHLLALLARSPLVGRLTVIDRDRYDATNVRGQAIDTRDVGLPKARAQSRRIRRIAPGLPVAAIHAPVERVPLGRMRGAVIVAALDSRRARLTVNQAAWRLGMPWIDAGVLADGLLARVQVFLPGEDRPCLECAWDQADYDAVDVAYPCETAPQAPATGAPAALGALAAALQAIECEKLLAGDAVHLLSQRDKVVDALHHAQTVTAYRRRPTCRMPDHAGWRIAPLAAAPDATTLDDVLALGSTLRGAGASLAFSVAGQALATELLCEACGAPVPTCQTERQLHRSAPPCHRCGTRLRAAGFALRDFVDADAVPAEVRRLALSALGVRHHDVITLRTPDLDAHFEVHPSCPIP